MTFSLSRASHQTCTARSTANQITILTYIDVWTQRRALARLDVNALKDLGISPADAAKEAARPFWDLPF